MTHLGREADERDILAAVSDINADHACTAFIVQLPLPRKVDVSRVFDAIDPAKDADGLHPANMGRLVLGGIGTKPCTPRAILELLVRHDVPITGAQYCVIGCGITVGRPLGLMLAGPEHHATVTLCNEATPDVATHARAADVIVAAAGVAHLVKSDWVKPGATVLSVGLTRTVEGVLGDVHPDVAQVAGRWARPTGGVGPMTRAMLLTNVVEITERSAAGQM
jgi:methylenetetrahydrofolate dehydrogenase (NADP+)/methenyltetrahydrofolate cyclohydrolase